MKLVEITGPGQVGVREADIPVPGPNDVLVKMKACGICGSDVTYMKLGGMPGIERSGAFPLGHEPAGEVAAVGSSVTDIPVGARVVISPMASPNGTIGNGGTEGALSEYLLLSDVELGVSLAILDDDVPYHVAALNEPLAVALHFVNRADPKPEDKVVVFGAGPIGLGATIWLKLRGVKNVVVSDIIPSRLQKALAVGADAVVNPSDEDLAARLVELHGASANAAGQPRAGTDIYMDAAGSGQVIEAAVANSKYGARIVVAAVHSKPVTVDLAQLLYAEGSITMATAYPTELFEVTKHLAEHWKRFEPIISDTFSFQDVEKALETARTPGAADKIVVTFD